MRSGRADDLNRERRNRRFALAIGVLLAAPALVVAQTRSHSFDVQGATAMVCSDGAVFDGATTAASAVNIVLTSEVYDAAGTTLLATGDAHTFTSVGETYTFTVLGAFTVGNTVTLSVTDTPGTAFGVAEGDADTATVADCSLDICGDGNVDPGETCDVADPAAPAGCRPAGGAEECTSCGDNSQQASEGCDDGNLVDGDGCSSRCTIEPFCGDGNVDPGEGCDDGNTMSGDGCSAMCMVEAPTLGQWGAIALGLALLAAALMAGGGGALVRGARGR